MDYKILESHIEFSKSNVMLMITVAIESSPGRFKAYRRQCGDISQSEIEQVAAYGHKLDRLEASEIFHLLPLKYKYEG
jgi:hypothetical protein